MFRSNNTGFTMMFANGWGISVQYSPMNYCANRRSITNPADHIVHDDGCANAEVAVFNPAGQMVELETSGRVLGWQTPDQVANLITFVSGNPYFLDVALQSNLEKKHG